jgi:hypothetical protein
VGLGTDRKNGHIVTTVGLRINRHS